MIPSPAQLLSWSPPALVSSAEGLKAQATSMQTAAGTLDDVARAYTASWQGEAADAAIAHVRRRRQELDDLAQVSQSAAIVLLGAADALAAAQSRMRAALDAAAAAGYTVSAQGAVAAMVPPAASPNLAGASLVSYQREADATRAFHLGAAAGLSTEIAAALAAAGAADAAGAGVMAQLNPPVISPAPVPVTMGRLNGVWGPLPPAAPAVAPASANEPAPPLPMCPTPEPQPAPVDNDENESPWYKDWVGAAGKAAYEAGPGFIGAGASILPSDRAKRLGQSIDDTGKDLSDWYDADTEGDAYANASVAAGVGGFIANPFGSAGRKGLKEGAERLAERAEKEAADGARRVDPPARPLPRDALPKPVVQNKKLQDLIDPHYRVRSHGEPIGNGSTADAIRHERATGEMVGGRTHTRKGRESIRALRNWLRSNPHAPQRERIIARSLMDDLQSALDGPL